MRRRKRSHVLPIAASARTPAQTPRAAIGFTAPVTITAAASGGEGATGAAPGPRRFTIAAYTGEPVHLWNFDRPVVIDLASADISVQSIPALYDHCPDENYIVGQVQTLTIDGPGRTPPLTATGIITPRATPPAEGEIDYARRVIERADAGYQWQASVGGSQTSLEQVEAGVQVSLNGRTYTGPLLIARGVSFREISFVVIGADRRTSAVIATSKPLQVRAGMSFEEWLLSMGFDNPSALTDVQRANMQNMYNDEVGSETPATATGGEGATATATPATTASAAPVTIAASGATGATATATVTQLRDQAANELERINAINRINASYGNPTIEVGEGRNRQRVNLAAHAIREGMSANDAELLALRASRATPNVVVSQSGNSHHSAIIETSLAISAGLRPELAANSLPAAAREQVMNAAVSSQWRGFKMSGLLDEVIRASGRSYSGARNSSEYFRAANEAHRTLEAAGFATLSLPGILGNLANKFLLAGYTAVNTTWQQFCAVRSHTDFKVYTHYRLDTTGAFRKIGPDGELKYISLAETGYTNKVETFGAIISVNRQMWMNDDIGAFASIPQKLGRLDALRIEEAVYALLLSNPGSFFGSGNKNLSSSNPLSLASLTALEQKFADQVDSNGKAILTTPAILLVPSALKATAESIWKQDKIEIAGSTDRTVTADNPHVGKFMPVSTPYLNNTALRDQDGAAFSGQSATQYYLFANPNDLAAIAIAFLNGQQTPTIESDDMPFNVLGYQWRAYHDFGVGMEDPVAAQKATGA